jgi:hypothetical protein
MASTTQTMAKTRMRFNGERMAASNSGLHFPGWAADMSKIDFVRKQVALEDIP